MIRYLWPVIGLVIAAGLQGNYPSSLTILGAKPDLILVVLIACSLAADPVFGGTLGFIAGLINGSMVGLSLGSFIVSRTMTGALAGFLTTKIFSDNPIVPMVSAGWITMACEAVFLLANPRPLLGVVIRLVLGKCIYNAIFTLVLYWILRHFDTNRKIKLAIARARI